MSHLADAPAQVTALAPVRDLAVKEPEVEATIRRIDEGNLLGSGSVRER